MIDVSMTLMMVVFKGVYSSPKYGQFCISITLSFKKRELFVSPAYMVQHFQFGMGEYHLILEGKQGQAWLVLGLKTAWEYQCCRLSTAIPP